MILNNEINRNGSHVLDGSGTTSPPYLDVNGDRSLGPLDVLQVINYINRRSSLGGGEGETASFVRIPSSESQSPFASFVLDAQAKQPTTWIVSNSTTVGRRELTGPERCGCPACTSFAPSGESSPAILDIATASNAKKPTAAQASKLGNSLANGAFESLDEFLVSWNV